MFPKKSFPAVSLDQWSDAAAQALNASLLDARVGRGLAQQILYTAHDRTSDLSACHQVVGKNPTSLDLRPEYADADLAKTKAAIDADINGGATSVRLRLDDEQSPADRGRGGIVLGDASQWDRLFHDVDVTKIGIAIDGGMHFDRAAASLCHLWQSRGIHPQQARGCFEADPLAHPSTTWITGMPRLVKLAAEISDRFPNVQSVAIDPARHGVEATDAVGQVVTSVAVAMQYLRSMVDGGMTMQAAAQQLSFRYAIGTRVFDQIAKLRAATLVWNRVKQVCGITEIPMIIHARSEESIFVRSDPTTNLVRNATAMFAALVAGVDVVTSLPTDHAIGLPDADSRRTARNTVHVLRDESHLGDVADAAGGSYFLDTQTDRIADQAWARIQDVEAAGGWIAFSHRRSSRHSPASTKTILSGTEILSS